MKFLRNWTLPISMLTGILSYFIYTGIHALDGTHAFMLRFIEVFQPLLLFCMLFVSFCKVAPGELRPHRWMLKLLGIQVGSFTLMGLFIALLPNVPGRVVIESAMICMICPTATAASVVTTKLHGNPSADSTFSRLSPSSSDESFPCLSCPCWLRGLSVT